MYKLTLATTRKMKYYKQENGILKHVILIEQLESLNNQHFIANEYIANLRVNRVTGDKRQLQQYKEQLTSTGYSSEFEDNVLIHPIFGLITNELGMYRIQIYLNCFEQIAIVSINSERLTDLQINIFKYLIESSSELNQLIIDKIKLDYYGTKEGVEELWEPAEINDCFPQIESNKDVLNLLSKIELSIYDEESMNHESSNGELIEIQANCPWDIEHGINLIIYKNEIEVTNNVHDDLIG